MLFLLFAVLASGLGIAVVLVRNRRPTSMEHSITEFERGLRALAPEATDPLGASRPAADRDDRHRDADAATSTGSEGAAGGRTASHTSTVGGSARRAARRGGDPVGPCDPSDPLSEAGARSETEDGSAG